MNSKKIIYVKQASRSLKVAVVLAILLGVFFLWDYFTLIAFAAILAFLFNPIYKKILKKSKGKSGLSAGLTFLIVVLTICIPLVALLVITIDQSVQIVDSFKNTSQSSSGIYDTLVNLIKDTNKQLDKLPTLGPETIKISQITDWLKSHASSLTSSAVTMLSGVAGGFTSLVTKSIIFIFVFMSLLKHQTKVLGTLKKMNPLGPKTSDHYLAKMGAMTSAMVKGQFMIAVAQGLVDALLLKIVGIDYFIFLFMFLTFLSIIPLGGGIIVLPIGVVMLLTGHIWQGLVLIIGHILIVTNIDNVLRPRFVPKQARLDSALLMLSVFAGLGFFGFLGIIIGPIVMIVIVTTIQIYLDSIKTVKTSENQ